MIVFKCLWIELSYFDIQILDERQHRHHGLTSCRFYVGLAEFILLCFRRLVGDTGVCAAMVFYMYCLLTVRNTRTELNKINSDNQPNKKETARYIYIYIHTHTHTHSNEIHTVAALIVY